MLFGVIFYVGQNKEVEKKRVDKELAHIRERFLKEPSMKGYDRKKYVCKLLYIFMLGYQFDFGHMEAVNLLSSLKYSEKQIVCAGHVFVSSSIAGLSGMCLAVERGGRFGSSYY